MKRLFPVLLLSLLLVPQCRLAYADEPAPPPRVVVVPTVTLPVEVKGQPGQFVKITAETNGTAVSWIVVDSGLNLFPVDLLKDTRTVVVTSPNAGRYRVFAVTAKGDVASEFAVATVVIGDAPPGPGPGPGPNPPDPPSPNPSPAPIPANGLHVLIIFDDKAKLPISQVPILYGKVVRDYLNVKCPAGTDGKTKEWRMWPSTADATNEAPLWQTAFKRPRATLPWIVVSDGKTGYDGPLPATLDEAMTLLKKYGGD